MARTKKTGADAPVQAIKGFDANLSCRNFQFAIGETYKHEGRVKACEGGFHVITAHPLAVFDYYAPAVSRFCRVTISGEQHSDDGEKTAAEILTVGEEVGLSDLVQDAVAWVMARSHPEGEVATGVRGAASATGYQGAASATGYQGAASATGYQGAASATCYQGAASATGDQGAASATGVQGAASATGDQGAASATGDRGAASATGYQGAASATGVQGAASATGVQGAASATGVHGAASATGDRGAASATGVQGAASATGYQGAASATGVQGAAMVCGHLATVSGAEGCALFATGTRDLERPVHFHCQRDRRPERHQAASIPVSRAKRQTGRGGEMSAPSAQDAALALLNTRLEVAMSGLKSLAKLPASAVQARYDVARMVGSVLGDVSYLATKLQIELIVDGVDIDAPPSNVLPFVGRR